MLEGYTLVSDQYGNYFYAPNTNLIIDQYGNYYLVVSPNNELQQHHQNPVDNNNYSCYSNDDNDVPMYGLNSLVEDSVIQDDNIANNSYCAINPALSPNINNMTSFNQQNTQPVPNNITEINPALNPNIVVPDNFKATEMDRMMTPHNKVINNSNATLQEPVLEFGDYVSGVPDMNPGSVFSTLMNSDSLENLMMRFPYQQLKISDNGTLIAAHPCNYDPVITNAFHVIYYSRMSKQQQNQTPKMTSEDVIHQIIPESNQKSSVFTPQYQRPGFVADKLVDTDDFIRANNDDFVNVNLYNLVDFESEKKPEELHGYEALEEAFHKEKENVVYDHGIEYRNYVQTGNEGFSFNYQNLPTSIELNTEVPAGYHPNPDYGKQKINPFISNTQPNNPYINQNPYQQRNQMMYSQYGQQTPPPPPYQYNQMMYSQYGQQTPPPPPYQYNQMMYSQYGQQTLPPPPYQYQYNQNFNNINPISGIKVVNREAENGGNTQNINTNTIIPKSYMGSSRNEPIDPTNPFENCGGPLADKFHDMVDMVRQQVAEIEALENKKAEEASRNTKAHFQIPIFNQGYSNMNNEQNNARTIYNQSYVNNPSRIEYGNNMVDFSNPESVAGTQYMGYSNGLNYNYSVPQVMNPNIQNNPYQYGHYQGNWYGNGYNIGGLSVNNITMVMKPTEMDKDNRWVVKGVTATREPITEEETKIEPQEDYFTRVKKAFTARATIVREPLESGVNKEEDDSLTKIDKTKNMIENTLDKMEQLYDDLDVEDFEVPEDHKLDWDDVKDSKLEKLAEQIAVYDKALANVIWNMPMIDQMTDEMSKFWLEYAHEQLEYFQKLEKKYPQLDCRISYRYRKVPKPTIIYDDGKMSFSPAPFMFPEKKYDEEGNRIYDYDRKRELTRDEWKLFRLKAMFDIKSAEIQKRAQWILQFNIDKIKRLKSKDKNGRREYSLLKEYRKKNPRPKEEEEVGNNCQYGYNNWYGYNDPFQNWVKERQKMIERQKYVYMKAFDHSMSLEEFNRFWDGPQANNQLQLDPTQRREQELLQATRTRIYQINQIQQYQIQNQQAQVNAFKTAEYQRLREFDKGCMEGTKTLKDYFDNMGYLVSMCIEDDLKKHKAENIAKLQNQYSYKKSLIRFGNEMNPEFGNNMRPNTVFGKADPAYGFPPNYIDLTKTDRYDAAKNQFMNYCQNTRGTIPLRPIYR